MTKTKLNHVTFNNHYTEIKQKEILTSSISEKTRNLNRICFLLVFILINVFTQTYGESVQEKSQIHLNNAEQDWLRQKHIVRVRVGHFPPLMFEDGGEIRGIAIEYVERIFNLHGIKYEYISEKKISWGDALKYMGEYRVVDLVPTAKITEERKKYLSFSDEYLFLPWVIFTRDDSPFISGIEDLKGKTVSVPKGFVMHGLLKEKYPEIKLKLNTAPNVLDKCVQQLASGVVDAYIGNLTAVTYLIQQKGYNNIKVSAPTPFGTHNQAMAMRNDWPELASIINKNMKAIKPAEHAAIKNKWMSIRYEYGISITDVIKWILGIALIAIIIIIIIFYWNRRLSREVTQRKKAEEQLKASLKEKEALFHDLEKEMLERKQTEESLKESEEKYRLLIENAGMGIGYYSPDGRALMFNKQALENLKGIVDPENYEGKSIAELFDSETELIMMERIQASIESNTSLFFEDTYDFSSGKLSFSSVFNSIKNEEGTAIGIQIISSDISERLKNENQIKSSLKEKETLLQEIHHRVKNNMQVISSLFNLQKMTLKNPETKDILQDAQNRVQAMSLIHETLYQSDNLSSINMQSYLGTLTNSIFQNYGSETIHAI